MQWSFRSIIGFDDARLDALLTREFDRREKEVHEQAPFAGVELIEQLDDHRIVKTFVAQVLAHVCPVFSLHVRIIVFV